MSLSPVLHDDPQSLASFFCASKTQKHLVKPSHTRKADIFQFQRNLKKVTGNNKKKKNEPIYKELAFLKVLKERNAKLQAPIYQYNSVRFPRVSASHTDSPIILTLQKRLIAMELKCKLETTPLSETQFDVKIEKFKLLGTQPHFLIIQDSSSQTTHLWYLQHRNPQTLQSVLRNAKIINISSEYSFSVSHRATWCIKWRYH